MSLSSIQQCHEKYKISLRIISKLPPSLDLQKYDLLRIMCPFIYHICKNIPLVNFARCISIYSVYMYFALNLHGMMIYCILNT